MTVSDVTGDTDTFTAHYTFNSLTLMMTSAQVVEASVYVTTNSTTFTQTMKPHKQDCGKSSQLIHCHVTSHALTMRGINLAMETTAKPSKREAITILIHSSTIDVSFTRFISSNFTDLSRLILIIHRRKLRTRFKGSSIRIK